MFGLYAVLTTSPTAWGILALFGLTLGLAPSLYFGSRGGVKTAVIWLSITSCGFVVVIPLVFGNAKAYRAMAQEIGHSTVELRDGPAVEDAVIVRQIERGIIVRRTKDEVLSFVPWTDVKRIAKPGHAIELRNLSCIVTGWLCPEVPPRIGG
jgi:hypothetical protein